MEKMQQFQIQHLKSKKTHFFSDSRKQLLRVWFWNVCCISSFCVCIWQSCVQSCSLLVTLRPFLSHNNLNMKTFPFYMLCNHHVFQRSRAWMINDQYNSFLSVYQLCTTADLFNTIFLNKTKQVSNFILLIHKLEGKIKTIMPKPESTSYMFKIEFMSDLGGSCSPEESFL